MTRRSVAIALGTALLLAVANVAIVWVWTAIAWGLRGMSYEEGRPTEDDLLAMRLAEILLAIAITTNVGVPLAGTIARRWPLAIGGVLGWALTPVSYALSIAGLALYASTLTP